MGGSTGQARLAHRSHSLSNSSPHLWCRKIRQRVKAARWLLSGAGGLGGRLRCVPALDSARARRGRHRLPGHPRRVVRIVAPEGIHSCAGPYSALGKKAGPRRRCVGNREGREQRAVSRLCYPIPRDVLGARSSARGPVARWAVRVGARMHDASGAGPRLPDQGPGRCGSIKG